MPQWIHLGTLLRPHGIKGEICIEWYADSPALLDAPLCLEVGKRPPYPVRIVSHRQHKGRPLVMLEGVADRNAAEEVGTLFYGIGQELRGGDFPWGMDATGLSAWIAERA